MQLRGVKKGGISIEMRVSFGSDARADRDTIGMRWNQHKKQQPVPKGEEKL